MKNYISLDIENPNTRGNSICSIGIVVVKNGKVVNRIYSLINPEDRFDTRNVKINGIDGSQVQDSPTLPEFWTKIDKLLSANVIIGHNITYDLTVISNSLVRYDIAPPTFRYYDTLSLTQTYMKLKSYKLSSIATMMPIHHEAHNALSDAEVAYLLFKFLDSRRHFSEDDALKFSASYLPRKNMDERLSTNINELVGIIEGIQYDKDINERETQRLSEWVKENEKYRCYLIFDDIIMDLKGILRDGVVTKYEQIKLTKMIKQIEESNIYTKSTLSVQVLRGILDGIISDEIINEQEILGLKAWLDDNDYLSDVYPYDKIYEIVSNVLGDGVITSDELTQLYQSFSDVLNPVTESPKKISLSGKTFCLTGDFRMSSKYEVGEKLKSLGGIEKSSVIKNLDYLFVGELGSDAWKYGKLGAKIIRAQELQEKGAPVRIIPESIMKKSLFG